MALGLSVPLINFVTLAPGERAATVHAHGPDGVR
jgi:uncharacterized cupin superfamily protein